MNLNSDVLKIQNDSVLMPYFPEYNDEFLLRTIPQSAYQVLQNQNTQFITDFWMMCQLKQENGASQQDNITDIVSIIQKTTYNFNKVFYLEDIRNIQINSAALDQNTMISNDSLYIISDFMQNDLQQCLQVVHTVPPNDPLYNYFLQKMKQLIQKALLSGTLFTQLNILQEKAYQHTGQLNPKLFKQKLQPSDEAVDKIQHLLQSIQLFIEDFHYVFTSIMFCIPQTLKFDKYVSDYFIKNSYQQECFYHYAYDILWNNDGLLKNIEESIQTNIRAFVVDDLLLFLNNPNTCVYTMYLYYAIQKAIKIYSTKQEEYVNVFLPKLLEENGKMSLVLKYTILCLAFKYLGSNDQHSACLFIISQQINENIVDSQFQLNIFKTLHSDTVYQLYQYMFQENKQGEPIIDLITSIIQNHNMLQIQIYIKISHSDDIIQCIKQVQQQQQDNQFYTVFIPQVAVLKKLTYWDQFEQLLNNDYVNDKNIKILIQQSENTPPEHIINKLDERGLKQ